MFAVIEVCNNRPIGCWVTDSFDEAVTVAGGLCGDNDLDVEASRKLLEEEGAVVDGDYTISVVLVSS